MRSMCCCGTAAEKADDEVDPEDEEHEMLNMPSLRSVMSGTVFVFLSLVMLILVYIKTIYGHFKTFNFWCNVM